MSTTPEEHDRDRAATITPRAKRFAIGAGAAGAVVGTLALLGAFQPNATAQIPTTDSGVSADSDSSGSGSSGSGSNGDGHHGHPRLTDEQRDCLADRGVMRPAERPDGPPTQEQIDAVKAAAEACGIELPAGRPGFGGPGRHGHPRLTDEQRECLADHGVTKPAERPDGPPTQEQIDALKAAAEACGIELPAGGPGFGGCNRDGSDDSAEASSTDAAIAA